MMMGQGLSQGASLDSRVKTGVLERLESLVAEQAKINLEREKAESALYAQRELCSAMLLWQEHANVARRVRGAITSMRHLHARRSLNAWKAAADSVAAETSTFARAAAGFLHRATRAAFNSWSDSAQALIAAKSILRAAVQSMRLVGLKNAVSTWNSTALALVATVRKLRAAAMSMRQIEMRKCFNQWSSAAAEASEAIAKLRAAATSMRQIEMRKCFNQWSSAAAEASEAIAKLRAATTSMRHVGLRTAMTTWAEATAAAVASLIKLRGAATSIRCVSSRSAFNSWQATAGSAASARLQLRAALSSLRTLGLRKAWNSWHGVVSATKGADERVQLATECMHQLGPRRALTVWALVATEKRKRRRYHASLSRAGAMRFSGGCLRAALKAWRRNCGGHDGAAYKRKMVLSHLCHLSARSKLRSVLMRWERVASKRRMARQMHAELDRTTERANVNARSATAAAEAAAKASEVASTTIRELEAAIKELANEASTLRVVLDTVTSDALWRSAHNHDIKDLRDALARTQVENDGLRHEKRELRERYEQLREAVREPRHAVRGLHVPQLHDASTPGVNPFTDPLIHRTPAVLDSKLVLGSKAALTRPPTAPARSPSIAVEPTRPASTSAAAGDSLSHSWEETLRRIRTPQRAPGVAAGTLRRDYHELLLFLERLPPTVQAKVHDSLRAQGVMGSTPRTAWNPSVKVEQAQPRRLSLDAL